jgi:hypothetical protein
MIAAYLEELAGTLRFDPALARRVAREVEDHLHEAIGAHPGDRQQAEREAVARFGEPRALAVQFAAIALVRRARRVGIAAVLAVVAVLAAMKVRLAWYAAMQWTLSEEARPLGAMVLAVDRTAFWLAIVVGAGTLLYIGTRRVVDASAAACRRQHRRAVFLCAAATASLVVSVTGDAVLTVLLLGGIEPSTQWAVPIVSLAVEIACVGAVIVMIAATIRRAMHAETLLKL